MFKKFLSVVTLAAFLGGATFLVGCENGNDRDKDKFKMETDKSKVEVKTKDKDGD